MQPATSWLKLVWKNLRAMAGVAPNPGDFEKARASRRLDEHVFIGVLQHQAKSGGAVAANQADANHSFANNIKERDVFADAGFTYEGIDFHV